LVSKKSLGAYCVQSKKAVFLSLSIIFVIACLLRIAPIVYEEWKNPGWHAANINEMEFYYDDVARSLLVGKGFVHSVSPRSPDYKFSFEPGTPFHFVPPLYAWWLYIIYFIFGPNVFIAKVIQCFLDASVCIFIYLLGKRIFEEDKKALLSAVLYAIYPLAIIMCSNLYYQIPLNVALCIVILGYMASVNWKNGFWTGVAVGVSALAKPVTLPFLLLLPAIRLAETGFKKALFKPALAWSVVFILAGLAVLAPWTIRNYIVFKKFVPVQHGGEEVFVQGSKEAYIDLDVNALRQKYPTGLAPSKQLTETAIRNHFYHIRENFFDYLRFMSKKFLLTWYNTEGKQKNYKALLVQTPFLIFAVISLLFSGKTCWSRPGIYVVATILYICFIQVMLFPLVRYTLAVMPLVMILSADGLILATQQMRLQHEKK